MNQKKTMGVKQVVLMGMFGALAGVLMVFEIPLPFIAPSFYGLDFSEVPVLVGTFSMGPVAGVIIELVKILVKLIIKPTTTGGVGELANFCIGCSLLLPAGLIYRFRRTKGGAIAGMAAGTVTMAIVGAVINALVMLPFYSNFMPLDTIIAAGAVINPAISNVWTFAWLCVAPFNLVKGVATALVNPVEVTKCVAVIPSSWAFAFIISAKALSDPAICSASPRQHSAPDGRITP